jgi:hypothetical protein
MKRDVMQTKITLILDNPGDIDAFEASYPALIEDATKFPGLISLESAKVFPKEDGTATPAFRTLDLYFDDYPTASKAVTTPEAGAFFEKLNAMNSTFTGLFSEVEDTTIAR